MKNVTIHVVEGFDLPGRLVITIGDTVQQTENRDDCQWDTILHFHQARDDDTMLVQCVDGAELVAGVEVALWELETEDNSPLQSWETLYCNDEAIGEVLLRITVEDDPLGGYPSEVNYSVSHDAPLHGDVPMMRVEPVAWPATDEYCEYTYSDGLVAHQTHIMVDGRSTPAYSSASVGNSVEPDVTSQPVSRVESPALLRQSPTMHPPSPLQAPMAPMAPVAPMVPIAPVTPMAPGLMWLVLTSAEGLPPGEYYAVVNLGGRLRLLTKAAPAELDVVWNEAFAVYPQPGDTCDFTVVNAKTGMSLGSFEMPCSDLMRDPGCDWQLQLQNQCGEVACSLMVRMEDSTPTSYTVHAPQEQSVVPCPPLLGTSGPPPSPVRPATPPPPVQPVTMTITVKSGDHLPASSGLFVDLRHAGQCLFTSAHHCNGTVVFDQAFPLAITPTEEVDVAIRDFDVVFGSAVLTAERILNADGGPPMIVELKDPSGALKGTLTLYASSKAKVQASPEHPMPVPSQAPEPTVPPVPRPAAATVEVVSVDPSPLPSPGSHITLEMRMQAGNPNGGSAGHTTAGDVLEGRVAADGVCIGQFKVPMYQLSPEQPAEIPLLMNSQPAGTVTLRSNSQLSPPPPPPPPPTPPSLLLPLPPVPSPPLPSPPLSSPPLPSPPPPPMVIEPAVVPPSPSHAPVKVTSPAVSPQSQPRYRQRIVRHTLDGRILTTESSPAIPSDPLSLPHGSSVPPVTSYASPVRHAFPNAVSTPPATSHHNTVPPAISYTFAIPPRTPPSSSAPVSHFVCNDGSPGRHVFPILYTIPGYGQSTMAGPTLSTLRSPQRNPAPLHKEEKPVRPAAEGRGKPVRRSNTARKISDVVPQPRKPTPRSKQPSGKTGLTNSTNTCRTQRTAVF